MRSGTHRLGVIAVAAGLAFGVSVASSSPTSRSTDERSSPSTWRPWNLNSPRQLRLAEPAARANSTVTRAELRELLRLQRRLTAKQRVAIAKWNKQPAVLPWTETALQMIVDQRPRPPFAARALAILETAMYDALLAAHDSSKANAKRARPAPWKVEPRIKPLLRASTSSYAPSEAAIAGAAERVLAYLFANAPASRFRRLADEALDSRLWAGVNYRSDLVRARRLGRKVAEIAIARAETDGANKTGFPGAVLIGERYWSPTPPGYEAPIGGPIGTWRPWLMTSPGQLRGVLRGPSPYGSLAFLDQVLHVLEVSETLTLGQRQTAFFWDDGPGTFTPAGHWFEIAIDLVRTFARSGPQAARVFAYLAATQADAAIAAFEAKYHWWSIRPITAIWRLCDSNARLCTEAEARSDLARVPHRNAWFPLITTPAFPSYPGGHSTFSGAAAELLTYFFPSAGRQLNRLAQEAADSRLYGGIHFDEDNKAGLVLGRAVAGLAVARAKREE